MKEKEISAFLSERIAESDFPSAVYLVAEKGEIIFADALGFAVVEPERITAKSDTIFDLASLTKPLVTALLCAKLIETGKINLTDKISKYLPGFESEDKQGITIQHLLTHVSGFPAWKPFYLLTDRAENVLRMIASHRLENPTLTEVIYSDFNFLTLGFLLEKLYGKRLDEIASVEIFNKLSLTQTFFNPPAAIKNEIAACEFGNEYEKQICRERGIDVENFAWRDYQIWGEVHDGNCKFLGGASGHAGLFSTAEETLKIAQQFLAEETILLKPETCELFRTNFTPNLNEARSLGFQLAATKDSTGNGVLAANSFGHLGFTGTSLWIEPASERIFILLTNRTHRDLPFVNINPIRRRFHELAVRALNKT
jgi:CubicO group peptidase (beta-lactamase class C family)